jgi:hypothetical protein
MSTFTRGKAAAALLESYVEGSCEYTNFSVNAADTISKQTSGAPEVYEQQVMVSFRQNHCDGSESSGFVMLPLSTKLSMGGYAISLDLPVEHYTKSYAGDDVIYTHLDSHVLHAAITLRGQGSATRETTVQSDHVGGLFYRYYSNGVSRAASVSATVSLDGTPLTFTSASGLLSNESEGYVAVIRQ